MNVPKKMEIELHVIQKFFFGYLPEVNQTNNFKRFMYYDVYFCIIYNRQSIEAT